MPTYRVSGVDKTSGAAATIELALSDRALALRIAELKHNMIVYNTDRIDRQEGAIVGLAWARAFLRLWLLADVLALVFCVLGWSETTLLVGAVVITAGVAIPLSLKAILNGVEHLVERAEELR